MFEVIKMTFLSYLKPLLEPGFIAC